MKIAPLLLTGSLVANAVLVGWILCRRQAAVPTPPVAAAAARRDAKTSENEQTLTKLRAALESGDLAALTAAGCSPDTARWLSVGKAFDKFQAKARAAQSRPSTGKYWQRGDLERPSREARLEGRKAERDFSDAIREAYGDDLESIFKGRESSYTFLPPDKVRKLRQIESDYSDMEAQIYAEQDGLTLPTDRNRLKLLRQEKERDIAAALTPEERQEMELHTSSIASNIRNQYGDAIATEEQYRKIFALRKAYEDMRNAKMEALAGAPPPADMGKWMNESEERIAEQVKAIVGPEQWAQAQQANDQEYRVLTSLAQRLNLPEAATAAAYAARETYAAQSMAINANTSLSPQERRTQLQNLGKQAKAALATTLTADGAQAYAERSGWLNMLKDGEAFSTNPKDAPNARVRLGYMIYPVPPPKQTSSPPGS